MLHLLIILRCTFAFVILPVSILLIFMPLFSEPYLLFYCSSSTEDPPGLLPTHCLAGARSPCHTIEVLTTCLLHFFYLLFILYFCFILNRNFLLGPVLCASKLLKLLKANCVILLFLLPQLVSIRNKDLQTQNLTISTIISDPDTPVISPPAGTS